MRQEFFIEKVNADSEILQPGEAKNLINCRLGNLGKKNVITNLPSTAQRWTPPAGENECIGSVVDEENVRLIWFNKNSLGNHGIYCRDLTGNYTVLLNNQTPGLNFSTYIEAKVVGGILYWTDNNDEPRRLDYQAAIKGNHPDFDYSRSLSFPLVKDDFLLIRRPPVYPIVLTPIDNEENYNFIKYEALQFAYRYRYVTGEVSKISDFSKTHNVSLEDTTYNSITWKIPAEEHIPQEVKEIEVIVKFLRTGKGVIIHTLNEEGNNQGLFAAHNAGGVKIEEEFSNDQAGMAISDLEMNTYFDSVPLKSKTIEVAKNRIFLANNTEGYDSPSSTSLQIEFSASDGTSVRGRWILTQFYTEAGGEKTMYLIDITGIGEYNGFYSLPDMAPPQTPPTTVSFPALELESLSQDWLTNLQEKHGRLMAWIPTAMTAEVLSGPVLETAMGRAIFKSDSSYQAGVVFYDHAQRRCGVVTNQSLRISTDDRTFGDIADYNSILWELSNDNALTEIPEWAETYSVVLTKPLRTRFFIQNKSFELKYVTKNSTTREYTLSLTEGTEEKYGIALNISNLFSYNLGYTYSEGDLIKIYYQDGIHTASVKEVYGDYVIAEFMRLGDFTTTSKAVYELYTPYKAQGLEFFYSQGERYTILDAGTSSRTYQVTTGSFTGDVYIGERERPGEPYIVEMMNPNDKYYKEWYTNAGQPHIEDSIGQQAKKYSISFSNVYLNNRVNGLSTFDALDEKSVDIECGEVNKLVLTSKVQGDGSVMLAICKNQTLSLYLGESQIMASSQNAFLAKADGVIGSINALRGSLGTSHRESVVEKDGAVWWWDAYNGVIAQYSAAGLDKVSQYGFESVFLALRENYETLCPGGYDPAHNEYLITIPTGTETFPDVEDVNYAVSHQSTFVYKPEENKWIGSHQMTPEHFRNMGTQLYSWKDGALYEHNQSGFNNIHGEDVISRVVLSVNQEPKKTKLYLAVSVQSNESPSASHFYTDYPNEQYSDVITFSKKEGVYYSPIYRDRLSPNIQGTAIEKLIKGDRMRSPAMIAQIEFNTTNKLELKFINVSYKESTGHKN